MSSCVLKIATLPIATSGRADEDLDIRAGAHAIEVDERVYRFPQRIDVERVRLVGTEVWCDDVRPGLAPEAQHQAEKRALGGEGTVEAGPAPERFELAPRPVDPALQPALHHHDGVYRAGTRPGDRFDGQAAVFEEGVEYAPREGAVGPAALQGERHGLSGARPGETVLDRMAPSAARHRAVPLEVPVKNHALVIEAPEGRKIKPGWSYVFGAPVSQAPVDVHVSSWSHDGRDADQLDVMGY